MKALSLSSNRPLRSRHDKRARQGARKFPRPDYHFQAPVKDTVALREQREAVGPTELRAFRQLSESYLGEAKHRGYLVDLLVFLLVVGLVTWSLVALVVLLAQTANG